MVAAQGTAMVDVHPALALKSVVRSGHPIEGRGPFARPRGIRQYIVSLRRFASPLALVLLWQAGSMAGLIPARTLAAPSTILLTACGLLVAGWLPSHIR